MRIACFHNRYRERGGEDAVVEAQVALLAKAGHEVRLVVVDNDDETRGLLGALRTGLRARWNPETVARVHAVLDDFPADVAHVHNSFPVWSPSLHHTLHASGVPVVQTLHNFRLVCGNGLLLREGRSCEECVGHGPWRAVRYGCYRGSRLQTAVWSELTAHHRRRGTWRDCVACFTVPSAAARDRLAAAGIPPERMRVLPNPVADPGVATCRGEGAVFVGRLAPEKGVDLLLEAWRALEGVPLTIVGGGPEEQRLRRQAAELPNVRFLGVVSPQRALAAIAEASFAVAPSRWLEVFGMSTAEAMALGRPVVVPGGTAMAERVVDGRSGAHFRLGDAASLAEACRDLARDPDRTAEMGALAREDYEAELAPDRFLAALERIYRSVTRAPAA